jgi:hypothetical protein
MGSFQEQMSEYKRQMEKGTIQHAYKGLMDYVLRLKTYLQTNHPDYSVSGSIYFGYMDMTYFSFTPEVLKEQGLKIAIVFLHEACRFEVWLAGVNKQVQAEYWQLFKDNHWDKYRVVAITAGADSIVEHTLVGNPDFGDLDALTHQIETEALAFIKDIEKFLSKWTK